MCVIPHSHIYNHIFEYLLILMDGGYFISMTLSFWCSLSKQRVHIKTKNDYITHITNEIRFFMNSQLMHVKTQNNKCEWHNYGSVSLYVCVCSMFRFCLSTSRIENVKLQSTQSNNHYPAFAVVYIQTYFRKCEINCAVAVYFYF